MVHCTLPVVLHGQPTFPFIVHLGKTPNKKYAVWLCDDSSPHDATQLFNNEHSKSISC